MPKISVILTSCNHGKYLEEAIDSVLSQTYQDYELIIWDDASDDNSWEIINKYKDNRIKAFRNDKRKRGVWGINKSIEEISKGEYIAIHHSDDIWESEKLEKQISFLENNREFGAVFTWAQIIDENGNNIENNWFIQGNQERWEWLNQLFKGENHLNHPSVLIRKKCYEIIGLYRYGLAQTGDAEIWSRLLLKFPIHVIEEKMTKHRFFSDKSNTSGDRIEVTIRTDNEWNLLRENFLQIDDFEVIASIFPGLERYRNQKGFNSKFLVAMACLYECEIKNAWPLGLKLLFDIIKDKHEYKKIKELYSFTYMDLTKLSEKYDVYNLSLLSERENQIARLIQKVDDSNNRIADYEKTKTEFEEKIKNLKRDLFESDGDLAKLIKEIKGHEAQNRELKREIGIIINSKSWKITHPLRLFVSKLKTFLLSVKLLFAGLIQKLRIILIKIHMPIKVKHAIKVAAFQNAGFIFRRCSSYKVWHQLQQIKRDAYSRSDSATADIITFKNEISRFSLDNINNKGRILVIDASTPTPDRDAGSVTAFFLMKGLVEIGYDVTFIPDDLNHMGRYTKNLCDLGVRCLTNNDIESIESFLIKEGYSINIVLLYRVHTARVHIQNVKKYASNAKVIFDTVDIHYLREERQAKIEKSLKAFESAAFTKKAELEMMRFADATIVLSEEEKNILKEEDPSLEIYVLPLLLEIPGCRLPYAERKNIVFIGGFLHQPNVDGIIYFVNEIWPIVLDKLINVKLLIVGSSPPQEVIDLGKNDASIEVTGFVKNLDPYFDNCRISIAPLRYGAGIKGKIGTSASYGVPCVATSLAIEGMGLIDGKEVLVADGTESFAEQLVMLYNNEELWSSISKNSFEFVQRNYSYEVGKKRIKQLLELLKSDSKNTKNILTSKMG